MESVRTSFDEAFLQSLPTRDEAMAVMYVLEGVGQPAGNFANNLIHTIASADFENRVKLAQSYPGYVRAVLMYNQEEGGSLKLSQLAGLTPLFNK